MKSFFNRNINKVTAIAVLIVLVSCLSGCRQGNWSITVYTTWGAEFNFANFWDALLGWPVAVLSYPIAWLMSNIGKLLFNSYAIGIIITTLIVRTLAWPIYSKQNGMQIKMQLIQPEMEKVQNKYRGRTDPESKQRMNMEMMQVYKKFKFNPLGCFISTFMQFPIFMSMYEVVRRINIHPTSVAEGGAVTIVEQGHFALMNTKIFNFFELNTSFYEATAIQDKIFAVVIAIAFGAITYFSQKLATRKPSYQKKIPNKNPNADQQMKQMKMMTTVMNVMFIFMCLSSTSLALYWLVGGIYQIFQSQIGRKINEKNYYKMKDKM